MVAPVKWHKAFLRMTDVPGRSAQPGDGMIISVSSRVHGRLRNRFSSLSTPKETVWRFPSPWQAACWPWYSSSFWPARSV